MSKTWLIIKREYLTRVRKKSFIIMSLLGPLLLAGVVIFSFWLNIKESDNQKIIVVDDNYPMFQGIDDTKYIDFEVQNISLDKALALLDVSDYTGVLYIPSNILNGHIAQLHFKKTPSVNIQRAIEQKCQQIIEMEKLEDFNIRESDYKRVKSPFYIQTLKFDGVNSTESDVLPAMVGWVFGIIIFMAVYLYSVQVMRGVIEEKTNRIVEVIISTVKPTQLLMGKIIGVGAVGLTQFVIWAFLSATGITIGQSVIMSQVYTTENVLSAENMTPAVQQQMLEENKLNFSEFSKDDNIFNSISRINFPLMLGLFIFYFIGGYLLYASMMAAVGSGADNDTDTQQFILPITFPLMLAYIVSISMFSNPESDIIVWMSIIPFTSPIIMIMRVAFGIESGDLWQVYLSMALLVATIALTVWASSKIYRIGILMYGKKLNYRDLIKWIKL
jgi:ABC-2 type transport system permease protein